MTAITSQKGAVGIAAVVSILLALWGGAAAMKTLMNALNIIYHEEEDRGYFKLTAVALALTLGFILIGAISIGLIVALPPILAQIGLGDAGRTAASLGRWPFLLVVALFGLAVLYRYAPSREKPEWHWVSPGAIVATMLWVAGSALFAVYAQNFGNYNKTYGSLAAIVVLMLWLYISAFAVLLGAEVNSAAEDQTGQKPADKDSQQGGQRRGRSTHDPAREYGR
jgi:membrane protein